MDIGNIYIYGFILCHYFPSKMHFSNGTISLALNISYLLHDTKSLDLKSLISSSFFSLVYLLKCFTSSLDQSHAFQCLSTLHYINGMFSLSFFTFNILYTILDISWIVQKCKCYHFVSLVFLQNAFLLWHILLALNISYLLRGTRLLDFKSFISSFFLEYFPMSFTSSLDQSHTFHCLLPLQ